FALRPALTEYIPFDMVGGLTWVRDDAADEEAVQRARRLFEDFMRDNAVPFAKTGEGGLGYGWREKAAAGDDFVGSYGRIFDVTVLGRPNADQAYPSMATLEAALFESGRPVLIAPPTPPQTLGEIAVIAWNGSTETARAIAFAMPLLHKARRVVALEIERGSVPGPSIDELARAGRSLTAPRKRLIAAASERENAVRRRAKGSPSMNRSALFSAVCLAALVAAGGASAKTLVYCSEGSPENFYPAVNTTGTSFD